MLNNSISKKMKLAGMTINYHIDCGNYEKVYELTKYLYDNVELADIQKFIAVIGALFFFAVFVSEISPVFVGIFEKAIAFLRVFAIIKLKIMPQIVASRCIAIN